MKRSRAFTLVELLMTMTLASTIMMLAIGLVHQSLTLSKLAKSRGDQERSTSRLATQFRHDSHAAEEVIIAAPDSIRFNMSGTSSVTYKLDNSNVTRELMGSGIETAHDLFLLDEHTAVQFLFEEKPQRAVLLVERKMEHADIPARIDLKVAAVVGRWRMLEHAEGGQP